MLDDYARFHRKFETLPALGPQSGRPGRDVAAKSGVECASLTGNVARPATDGHGNAPIGKPSPFIPRNHGNAPLRFPDRETLHLFADPSACQLPAGLSHRLSRTQYPPGMDIPSYNFYYLADEKNNPGRGATWINSPYVDPAGRGWMISCLAPVYVDNELEGVCGLDITVEALVRGLDLEADNNLCILVSNAGTVVAAGEIMSRLLRLPNLKRHRYVDTVRCDTLRSDDCNLRKSSSLSIRKMIDEVTLDRMGETELEVDGRNWRVRAATAGRPDWHVLEFSPLS